MTDSVFPAVCELIHKHSAELAGRQLEPDEKIADLGIDSLERLSLVVDIENRFGLMIDDADLSDVHTVGELAGLVRLQSTK
ncbi:acyl carrier protein [Streptomyces sp. NPDC020731]|uniref:acyl carrier protein n=1 Tax=Streptomyces sp. NPDC020731 TaxID=3365085 RepID=UPI0037B89D67